MSEPARLRVLFDFADPATADRWRAINDAVMGGRSEGDLLATGEGTALFEGRLSLEQGGGFASVRSVGADHDLAGYAGISVVARGDGRRYKIAVKTDDALDGIQYQAGLDLPQDAWATARVPFLVFVPVLRGRPVAEAPPLDPAGIRQFGLIIADRQEGDFCLEIARIEAWTD